MEKARRGNPQRKRRMAMKNLWKRKFVKVFRQFENKCTQFILMTLGWVSPEQYQTWFLSLPCYGLSRNEMPALFFLNSIAQDVATSYGLDTLPNHALGPFRTLGSCPEAAEYRSRYFYNCPSTHRQNINFGSLAPQSSKDGKVTA